MRCNCAARGGIVAAHADVAQLVERNLAKVEVAGSNPVVRSNQNTAIPTMGAGIDWAPRLPS